jgi:hypothetical protein
MTPSVLYFPLYVQCIKWHCLVGPAVCGCPCCYCFVLTKQLILLWRTELFVLSVPLLVCSAAVCLLLHFLVKLQKTRHVLLFALAPCLLCVNDKHLEFVFSWRFRMFSVRYEPLFFNSWTQSYDAAPYVQFESSRIRRCLFTLNISDFVCPVMTALTRDSNYGPRNSVTVRTYRRRRPGASLVAAHPVHLASCMY